MGAVWCEEMVFMDHAAVAVEKPVINVLPDQNPQTERVETQVRPESSVMTVQGTVDTSSRIISPDLFI